MGLKIRFPKQIWDDYRPNIHIQDSTNPIRKLTIKLRFPPVPHSLQNRVVKRRKCHSIQGRSTSCKVKLFRFHYGGPNRQHKGRWQNEITCEQPCLQQICPNCTKWYPHLVRELIRSLPVKMPCGSSLSNDVSALPSHNVPSRIRYEVDPPDARDTEHVSDPPACMTFPTQEGKSKFRELIMRICPGKGEEV
jgi:hypothetical protein